MNEMLLLWNVVFGGVPTELTDRLASFEAGSIRIELRTGRGVCLWTVLKRGKFGFIWQEIGNGEAIDPDIRERQLTAGAALDDAKAQALRCAIAHLITGKSFLTGRF